MIKNIFACDESLSRLNGIDFNYSAVKYEYKNCPIPKDSKAPLYQIVFAPGKNGWPSSDLSIDAEKLRDPSVQQFVSDNLRQVHSAVGNVVDVSDADIADSVKSQLESTESYISRRVSDIDNFKDSLTKKDE